MSSEELQNQEESETVQSNLGLSQQELQQNIEGYCFPILSPFGKVLSLNASLYEDSGSISEIEKNLSKCVRPFCGYSTQRSSFSDEVKNFSRNSIFEQLGVQRSTHECFFSSGNGANELQPYQRLSQLILSSLSREKSNVKINVYLGMGSSYDGVLPWLSNIERVRIIPIESDSQTGTIKPSSLVSAVLKNATKAKIQLISVNALSMISRQPIDLQAIVGQIDALRTEFPKCVFFGVVEGSPLLSAYPKKYLIDILMSFDFAVFQASKMLGGSSAASFILAKKTALAHLPLKTIIPDLIQEQSPSELFRTAQILAFYNREHIDERVIQGNLNSKLFFDEVQAANQRLQEISVLNKIDILGLPETGSEIGRYAIRILTESSEDFLEQESRGYPTILARNASQLLHDVFGILSKPMLITRSTNNFRFTSPPKDILQEFGLLPEAGFKELNSSPLIIDIHFLLSPADIIYLVSALEQLALNGNKLLKYYNRKTMKPKMFILPKLNITLDSCSVFHQHKRIDEEERVQIYGKQLSEGTKILKAPQNYFSMQENWTEDRTVIFPLNALFDAFPTKQRILKNNPDGTALNEEEEILDDDVDAEQECHTERFMQKREAQHSQAVEQARNLILRIKNNIPDKAEEPQLQQLRIEKQPSLISEQLIPMSAISIAPPQSLEEDEEENRKITEERMNQIRKEIRLELEKEQKNKQGEISFNEQMKLREQRTKHLKTIFIFYASLPDVLDDKKDNNNTNNDKTKKDTHSNSDKQKANLMPMGIVARQQLQRQIEANLKMAANKFFKFCHDFELINTQLDIKTLYNLFTKVSDMLHSSVAIDIRNQEISFNQFQLLIEKMASVYFENNDQLFTQLDKSEQFSRVLGLDDPRLFKPKLKPDGLVKFSYIFHDKYQLFSPGPVKEKFYNQALQEKQQQDEEKNSNNISEKNSQKLISSVLIPSPREKKTNVSSKSLILEEGQHFQQLKKDNNRNLIGNNVWECDKNTMNSKLLYTDNKLSNNDVFSEVALLSSTRNRLQPLRYHSNDHVKSETNIAPHNSGNNEKLPPASKFSILSQMHQLQPLNSERTTNSQQQYQQNSVEMQLQQYQQHNAGNIHKFFLDSPKSPQIRYDVAPSNGSGIQASNMKQQLLSRAKQIATMEKERDSHRINSPNLIASQSVDISSWNYTEPDAPSSYYIKTPTTSSSALNQKKNNKANSSSIEPFSLNSISRDSPPISGYQQGQTVVALNNRKTVPKIAK